MKKIYIYQKPEPIGMYITDGTTLSHGGGAPSYWITHKQMPYLPILSCLHISTDNEIRLASGESISSDITSYNETYRLIKMDEDVVKKSKLDITSNDLFIGPIQIGLNFTGKRITVTDREGIPKSFAPLSFRGFSDLDGKFVIISVRTVNSTNSIHNQYGLTNYIKILKSKLAGKLDRRSIELHDVYDYILNCHNSKSAGSILDVSDTYKVAFMTIIDVDRHIQNTEGKSCLYLQNKDIEITYSDIINAPMHDMFTYNYSNDPVVMSNIRENGFSCFIVDNHDEIGERYINFAGEAKKVPKMKSNDKLSGFYSVSIDADKTMQLDNFTKMEDIDKVNYLYKSIEEATNGANIREQYSNEVEIQKLDKVSETIKLKSAYEARLIELEERRRKEEFEHKNRMAELAEIERKRRIESDELERKRTREFEEMMLKFKLQTEERKQRTEDHKFNYDANRFHMDNTSLYVKREYEQAKYERDSTIETIKTVGAIAGLIAGGYALYSKFSN